VETITLNGLAASTNTPQIANGQLTLGMDPMTPLWITMVKSPADTIGIGS